MAHGSLFRATVLFWMGVLLLLFALYIVFNTWPSAEDLLTFSTILL